MARTLKENEREIYIQNRNFLHSQLVEIQADLEDMTDKDLIELRSVLLYRVDLCMRAILKTDEDNEN